MTTDLNNIIKAFEGFAKLGKLNKSPIDRLFNENLKFKLQDIPQLQAPPANPNESMFTTNTSTGNIYGQFIPNSQFNSQSFPPLQQLPPNISPTQYVYKKI